MESKLQVQWEAIKEDDEYCESSSASASPSSSSSFYSSGLSSSSSDMDMVDDHDHDHDDASSSCGPLYELADLMTQLPIKRGLSKFYNGKSQTFACLSNVKSNEDLGKEMKSWGIRGRMKSCKSYGVNLHKVGPKATITKRSPKILCSSFGTKSAINS